MAHSDRSLKGDLSGLQALGAGGLRGQPNTPPSSATRERAGGVRATGLGLTLLMTRDKAGCLSVLYLVSPALPAAARPAVSGPRPAPVLRKEVGSHPDPQAAPSCWPFLHTVRLACERLLRRLS